jgi:hypothetical protein
MDENEREKSPYHGVWMLSLIMIGVPLILYLVFVPVFRTQGLVYPELVTLSARVLSGAVGVMVHFVFLITGVFRESMAVVRARLDEFFDDLKLDVGFAFKDYWYNIKVGGVAFLIYFVIMAGTAIGFAVSLIEFLRIAPI